jgi:hypothetical protein
MYQDLRVFDPAMRSKILRSLGFRYAFLGAFLFRFALSYFWNAKKGIPARAATSVIITTGCGHWESQLAQPKTPTSIDRRAATISFA